jgi:hypothetical protein
MKVLRKAMIRTRRLIMAGPRCKATHSRFVPTEIDSFRVRHRKIHIEKFTMALAIGAMWVPDRLVMYLTAPGLSPMNRDCGYIPCTKRKALCGLTLQL